mgnify:CR=1 FL=1
MAAGTDLSLDAQVELVEKRMALRRARIVAELVDVRTEASRVTARATRYLPLAGAAAALVVGFVMARKRPAAAVVRGTRMAPSPAPVATPVARGLLATAVALAAGSLRFATSAEGRMLWQAFKAARARAQRPSP